MYIKFVSVIVLFFLAGTLALSQNISYHVSFPNIAHHEARIAITITGNKSDSQVFVMSRSSPGRYDTHPFGKNVFQVSAADGNGKPLMVEQPHTDEYLVKSQQGTITLTYTLYGNFADGTFVDIDPSGAIMNIPASFIWVKDLQKAPIEVNFHLPESKNWTIATQMVPTANPTVFTAPDLQYFMDCPVVLADLKWRQWEISNPGNKTEKIRLAFNGKTSDMMLDEFTGKLQKLVLEEQAVFGETPAFDYGTYTFLANIHPYIHQGDGMEHRNSTIVSERAVFDGSNDFLSTFSHEFFHCWNVERIRPAGLEPFDFTNTNITDGLWFAEGFTQYYGNLLMVRAGFKSLGEFAERVNGWVQAKNFTPGGKYYSPLEISRKAVFTDAGNSVERKKENNYYVSYYSLGAAVALALDLELRNSFGNTLDDYMKLVWQRFGKTELPYTMAGLEDALVAMTNKNFATDFFKKYIYGHEIFDYKPLLEKGGFSMVRKPEAQAWLGNIVTTETPNGLQIMSQVVRGTPLYDAGLDIDDVLISIDGRQCNLNFDLYQILKGKKPGDEIEITYKHRDTVGSTTVNLVANPGMTVVPMERFAEKIPASAVDFRQKWLGSKLR